MLSFVYVNGSRSKINFYLYFFKSLDISRNKFYLDFIPFSHKCTIEIECCINYQTNNLTSNTRENSYHVNNYDDRFFFSHKKMQENSKKGWIKRLTNQ